MAHPKTGKKQAAKQQVNTLKQQVVGQQKQVDLAKNVKQQLQQPVNGTNKPNTKPVSQQVPVQPTVTQKLQKPAQAQKQQPTTPKTTTPSNKQIHNNNTKTTPKNKANIPPAKQTTQQKKQSAPIKYDDIHLELMILEPLNISMLWDMPQQTIIRKKSNAGNPQSPSSANNRKNSKTTTQSASPRTSITNKVTTVPTSTQASTQKTTAKPNVTMKKSANKQSTTQSMKNNMQMQKKQTVVSIKDIHQQLMTMEPMNISMLWEMPQQLTTHSSKKSTATTQKSAPNTKTTPAKKQLKPKGANTKKLSTTKNSITTQKKIIVTMKDIHHQIMTMEPMAISMLWETPQQQMSTKMTPTKMAIGARPQSASAAQRQRKTPSPKKVQVPQMKDIHQQLQTMEPMNISILWETAPKLQQGTATKPISLRPQSPMMTLLNKSLSTKQGKTNEKQFTVKGPNAASKPTTKKTMTVKHVPQLKDIHTELKNMMPMEISSLWNQEAVPVRSTPASLSRQDTVISKPIQVPEKSENSCLIM